jgi:pyridoxine kinase
VFGRKNMRSPVPKIAAIHDLSGFGRASLTVIIPILSAMGIQVCPLPTAVLSTHTGGFEKYRFVDFTPYMRDFMEHWLELNLEFEAVYSGFLGSAQQIRIVSDFIDAFAKASQIVMVDPVMGDDGKAYRTVTPEMVEGMRELIKKAHIVTPNFTEASFLLNSTYSEHIEPQELKEWMHRLSGFGPKVVIITSVPVKKDTNLSTVVAYNTTDDRFWKVDCRYIPAHYPGTGDLFTSVMLGSLLRGDSLPIALDRAVQFASTAIKVSFGYDLPKRDGVLLEHVLNNLNAPLTSITYEIVDW